MGRKHSVSRFQDEWLSDKFYSKWFNNTAKVTESRCILCKKIFGISHMGVFALNSRAAGNRHKSKMLEKSSIDIRFFGNKINIDSRQASSIAEKK